MEVFASLLLLVKSIHMETKASLIEPLLERVEQYSKTSYELLKLKSLDKAADITSGLIARLLLIGVLCLFTLTLNIATALWLGTLLGKFYYGFFIVASFYGLIAIVLLFIHPIIKVRVNNTIIKQMLN
jgi:hypothetical protein